MSTGSNAVTRDVWGADASGIAFGVIIGVCGLVMLLPFAGVAFVGRDVLRQRRIERGNSSADADLHEEDRDA